MAKLIMPSNDTDANNDVEGKRKGFMLPFTATTTLRIASAVFKMLKKTSNSGRLGLSAT